MPVCLFGRWAPSLDSENWSKSQQHSGLGEGSLGTASPPPPPLLPTPPPSPAYPFLAAVQFAVRPCDLVWVHPQGNASQAAPWTNQKNSPPLFWSPRQQGPTRHYLSGVRSTVQGQRASSRWLRPTPPGQPPQVDLEPPQVYLPRQVGGVWAKDSPCPGLCTLRCLGLASRQSVCPLRCHGRGQSPIAPGRAGALDAGAGEGAGRTDASQRPDSAFLGREP